MSNSNECFKLTLSTQQYNPTLEVFIDDVKKRQIVQDKGDFKEFYSSCEKIIQMAVLDQPMPKKLLEDLH